MTPRAAVCSSTICPGDDQVGQAPVWSGARRSLVRLAVCLHMALASTRCRREDRSPRRRANEPAGRPLAPWAVTCPRPPSARQRRGRARRTRHARACAPRHDLALPARAAGRLLRSLPAGEGAELTEHHPVLPLAGALVVLRPGGRHRCESTGRENGREPKLVWPSARSATHHRPEPERRAPPQ
jgi:hypothetical protein